MFEDDWLDDFDWLFGFIMKNELDVEVIEEKVKIELKIEKKENESIENVKTIKFIEGESDKEEFQIHLIGTAHVSTESIKEVSKFIEKNQPKYTLIELCQFRKHLLVSPKEEEEKEISIYELFTKLVIKEKSILKFCLSYFNLKISKKLKVLPGGEFKIAFEKSKEFKIPCYLIDRPINQTLNRIWSFMGFFSKLKFITYLIYASFFDISMEDVEKLKEGDIITKAMEELSKEFPELTKVLINERDIYMSLNILNCFKKLKENKKIELKNLKKKIENLNETIEIKKEDIRKLEEDDEDDEEEEIKEENKIIEKEIQELKEKEEKDEVDEDEEDNGEEREEEGKNDDDEIKHNDEKIEEEERDNDKQDLINDDEEEEEITFEEYLIEEKLKFEKLKKKLEKFELRLKNLEKEKQSIVVVIGKGHQLGIEYYLKNQNEIPEKEDPIPISNVYFYFKIFILSIIILIFAKFYFYN